MTRVFLCDDSQELRFLLRTFLEAEGDLAVVGEAGECEDLGRAVHDSAADVVVLDLSMPRSDGLAALPALREAVPDLGIVVLSGFDRGRMAARALALGADSYLEKTCGMDAVRATVRAAATGRRNARSRRA